MQTACEPLHIQFNQDDSTVAVINRTFKGAGPLTADVTIYSTSSKVLYKHAVTMSLSETGTASAMPLKNQLTNINELAIVVLDLKDATGKVISRNTYWTAAGNDYKGLNDMSRTNVTTTVVKTEKGAKENKYTLHIANNSSKLAFFVRPQLLANGDEVMPSCWSANYFTLAPGQSVTVSVTAPIAKLGNAKPAVLVEGWNVEKQTIDL
jgi:hypothetical protein